MASERARIGTVGGRGKHSKRSTGIFLVTHAPLVTKDENQGAYTYGKPSSLNYNYHNLLYLAGLDVQVKTGLRLDTSLHNIEKKVTNYALSM